METQLKKVTSIQGAGTYDKGPHGLLFSFDYAFEDNTTLRANHKTQQPPFKEGDDVEVIVKGTKDGFSWGSVKRPGSSEYNAPSSNSTSPTSVTKYEDREEAKQHRIMNQWAIARALEWEMNSAPPSEVNLVQAIAMAQKLKEYALNLDTISFGNSSEGIKI